MKISVCTVARICTADDYKGMSMWPMRVQVIRWEQTSKFRTSESRFNVLFLFFHLLPHRPAEHILAVVCYACHNENMDQEHLCGMSFE